MICLKGDEPPIDAVMISAKKIFSRSLFLVGFYGTQINGPPLNATKNEAKMKNSKKNYFLSCWLSCLLLVAVNMRRFLLG
jgi:hypothetical protein